jgi:prepilin-type N-terminal cleavage/methylation domain-containing protein
MNIRPQNKGFTLIELLVVISIIAILSSITMAMLNQARVKTRDTQRTAQMQQFTLALQVYFTDHGRYPSTSSGNYVQNIVGLAPEYIPKLPEDPRYKTGTNRYRYASNDFSKGYTILANYEGDSVTWCRIEAGAPGVTAWDQGYPTCN